MSDNLKGSWYITRMELGGKGTRKGTNPKGDAPHGFHLGQAPYAAASPAASDSGYSSPAPSSGLAQGW